MCACVCVCVCARGRRAGCCGRAGPGRSGRWTTSPPSSPYSEPGRPAGRPGSKPFFFTRTKTEAHSPSPALGPGLAGGEVASTVRVTTRNTVPVTSRDRAQGMFRPELSWGGVQTLPAGASQAAAPDGPARRGIAAMARRLAVGRRFDTMSA